MRPVWFFILIVAAFLFVVLKSRPEQKKYGRAAGRQYRRRGFAIAAICVFVLTLSTNAETYDEMICNDIDDRQHIVTYGKEPAGPISERKLPDEDRNFGDDADSSNPNDEDPDITQEPEAAELYPEFELTDGTTLPENCVQIIPAAVSSDTALSKYQADKLADNDISTSWQTTIDSPESFSNDSSVSENLYFDFGEPVRIDYIVIYNGTPDSSERFYRNGRAKTISVTDCPEEDDDGTANFITLNDVPECQVILCSNFEASSVAIDIYEMYEGSKYPELCVSEVQFFTLE